MPDMKNVWSSHVDTVGYDPQTKELHVQFVRNGKLTVYKDVPQGIANEVMSSYSVGTALHELVRGRFTHEYR